MLRISLGLLSAVLTLTLVKCQKGTKTHDNVGTPTSENSIQAISPEFGFKSLPSELFGVDLSSAGRQTPSSRTALRVDLPRTQENNFLHGPVTLNDPTSIFRREIIFPRSALQNAIVRDSNVLIPNAFVNPEPSSNLVSNNIPDTFGNTEFTNSAVSEAVARNSVNSETLLQGNEKSTFSSFPRDQIITSGNNVLQNILNGQEPGGTTLRTNKDTTMNQQIDSLNPPPLPISPEANVSPINTLVEGPTIVPVVQETEPRKQNLPLSLEPIVTEVTDIPPVSLPNNALTSSLPTDELSNQLEPNTAKSLSVKLKPGSVDLVSQNDMNSQKVHSNTVGNFDTSAESSGSSTRQSTSFMDVLNTINSHFQPPSIPEILLGNSLFKQSTINQANTSKSHINAPIDKHNLLVESSLQSTVFPNNGIVGTNNQFLDATVQNAIQNTLQNIQQLKTQIHGNMNEPVTNSFENLQTDQFLFQNNANDGSNNQLVEETVQNAIGSATQNIQKLLPHASNNQVNDPIRSSVANVQQNQISDVENQPTIIKSTDSNALSPILGFDQTQSSKQIITQGIDSPTLRTKVEQPKFDSTHSIASNNQLSEETVQNAVERTTENIQKIIPHASNNHVNDPIRSSVANVQQNQISDVENQPTIIKSTDSNALSPILSIDQTQSSKQIITQGIDSPTLRTKVEQPNFESTRIIGLASAQSGEQSLSSLKVVSDNSALNRAVPLSNGLPLQNKESTVLVNLNKGERNSANVRQENFIQSSSGAIITSTKPKRNDNTVSASHLINEISSEIVNNALMARKLSHISDLQTPQSHISDLQTQSDRALPARENLILVNNFRTSNALPSATMRRNIINQRFESLPLPPSQNNVLATNIMDRIADSNFQPTIDISKVDTLVSDASLQQGGSDNTLPQSNAVNQDKSGVSNSQINNILSGRSSSIVQSQNNMENKNTGSVVDGGLSLVKETSQDNQIPPATNNGMDVTGNSGNSLLNNNQNSNQVGNQNNNNEVITSVNNPINRNFVSQQDPNPLNIEGSVLQMIDNYLSNTPSNQITVVKLDNNFGVASIDQIASLDELNSQRQGGNSNNAALDISSEQSSKDVGASSVLTSRQNIHTPTVQDTSPLISDLPRDIQDQQIGTVVLADTNGHVFSSNIQNFVNEPSFVRAPGSDRQFSPLSLHENSISFETRNHQIDTNGANSNFEQGGPGNSDIARIMNSADSNTALRMESNLQQPGGSIGSIGIPNQNIANSILEGSSSVSRSDRNTVLRSIDIPGSINDIESTLERLSNIRRRLIQSRNENSVISRQSPVSPASEIDSSTAVEQQRTPLSQREANPQLFVSGRNEVRRNRSENRPSRQRPNRRPESSPSNERLSDSERRLQHRPSMSERSRQRENINRSSQSPRSDRTVGRGRDITRQGDNRTSRNRSTQPSRSNRNDNRRRDNRESRPSSQSSRSNRNENRRRQNLSRTRTRSSQSSRSNRNENRGRQNTRRTRTRSSQSSRSNRNENRRRQNTRRTGTRSSQSSRSNLNENRRRQSTRRARTRVSQTSRSNRAHSAQNSSRSRERHRDTNSALETIPSTSGETLREIIRRRFMERNRISRLRIGRL